MRVVLNATFLDKIMASYEKSFVEGSSTIIL